jgi:hypothetical protein
MLALDNYLQPPISNKTEALYLICKLNKLCCILKPDHKNKKPRHVAENPWDWFFSYKILGRSNIKCQNEPVLPPAQVFYFIG